MIVTERARLELAKSKLSDAETLLSEVIKELGTVYDHPETDQEQKDDILDALHILEAVKLKKAEELLKGVEE